MNKTPQTELERTMDSFRNLPRSVSLLDDPTWMALIAAHYDPILQSLQAGNRQIGDFPFVAHRLMANRWENVRETLARNPSIFELPDITDITERLARDPSNRVRSGLAANPALFGFPEIALLLAGDESTIVRETLATNPAVTGLPGVVDKLMADPDGSVRDCLAETLAARLSESETAWLSLADMKAEGEVS